MSDILSEREPLIFYPKHAVEAERKLHEARISAQAAEIERLRGDLAKAVEALGCWNRMMNKPAYDMGEMVSEFDAIARTTLAELTGGKDG